MDRKALEVAILAGLVYFTQGAMGVAGVALPLFMRGLDWSVSEITAITSIAAFPWVLKIFYGLISDSFPLFSYRRKSYLFLCPLLSAFGWIGIAFLPASKGLIIGSLVLGNIGIAATDVITDGLIVENSEGKKSHIFQSIAWGSRSVGAILSGVAGGWLAEHWQYNHIFLLTAALPILIFIAAYKIEEDKTKQLPFHTVFEPLKKCFAFLMGPNLRWYIAFLFLSQVPVSFGVPFFFHMKENLGFRESFLGFLISLGWVGVIISSFVYAKWLNRVPPKKILNFAIMVSVINILSTLLIRNELSALIFVFIGGILGCLALLPVMSVSAILTHNTGVEGTLFAVLMSLHNLGVVFFGFLGSNLFKFVGIHTLIIGSALVMISTLWIIKHLKFDTESV